MINIKSLKSIIILLFIFLISACNKNNLPKQQDTNYIYVYPFATISFLFPAESPINGYDECLELMEKGFFSESSDLLKNVLKNLEQNVSNSIIEKAKVLTALGICNNALFKNQIAEKFLREAKQIILSEVGSESHELAIASNNLAGVLLSQKKIDQALNEIILANKIAQFNTEISELDLNCLKINYATILISKENTEEGISLYEKLLKSFKENTKNEKLVLAHLKDSFAFVNTHKLGLEESNRYCDEAIDDFKNYADENHTRIAPMLISKGFINAEYGHYYEALDYYNQALELVKNSSSGNSATIEQIYSNLGLCYDGIGDYINAEDSYQKALEIAYKYEELRWDISTIYNNLGVLYTKKNNFKAAQNYFLKSYFNIYSDPYSLQSQELYKKNIQIIYEEDGGEADQFEAWLEEQKDKEEFQPYSYASSSSTS